jgi:hypothetical protein
VCVCGGCHIHTSGHTLHFGKRQVQSWDLIFSITYGTVVCDAIWRECNILGLERSDHRTTKIRVCERLCGTMSSEAVAVPVVAAHPKGRVVLPIHVVPIRCVYCVISISRTDVQEREREGRRKKSAKKANATVCCILRG